MCEEDTFWTFQVLQSWLCSYLICKSESKFKFTFEQTEKNNIIQVRKMDIHRHTFHTFLHLNQFWHKTCSLHEWGHTWIFFFFKYNQINKTLSGETKVVSRQNTQVNSFVLLIFFIFFFFRKDTEEEGVKEKWVGIEECAWKEPSPRFLKCCQ